MKNADVYAEDNGKDLLFATNRAAKPGISDDDQAAKMKEKPWKVMIIDDEDVVHQVTVMVLADYVFEGRPVEIIQGYSGGACRNLMKKYPDTAVLLLDVVMETEMAGLDTVKYIREELKNRAVRIIIRTGQPGQVSEKQISSQYDINGFKHKTELTAQNLFACISDALCAYRDLPQTEQ